MALIKRERNNNTVYNNTTKGKALSELITRALQPRQNDQEKITIDMIIICACL